MSKKHVVSFVHIPKTGGQWLHGVLKKYFPNYLSTKDGAAIQLSSMDQDLSRRWRMPAVGLSYSAWEKIPIVNAQWEDTFKLSICRNPFDMLVSIYHHHNPESRDVNLQHLHPGVPLGNANINVIHGIKSFDDFIKKFCDPGFPWAQVLDAERYFLFHQLFTDTGECGVDIILRNERLNEATATFLEKTVAETGSAADEIRLEARINESKKRKRKDYRSYYTDELRELVELKCNAELILFGYDFDGSTNDALYVDPRTLYYSSILPLAAKDLDPRAVAMLKKCCSHKIEKTLVDPLSYSPLVNVLQGSRGEDGKQFLMGQTSSAPASEMAYTLPLALEVPYFESLGHLRKLGNSKIAEWHPPTKTLVDTAFDLYTHSGGDPDADWVNVDIEESIRLVPPGPGFHEFLAYLREGDYHV